MVFGGRSTEHAVSCVSASSVLAALDPELFDVTPIGITPEGRWVLTSGDRSELEIRDRVRAFGEKEVLPRINDYWERAEFPCELVPKIAELGIPGGTI